MVSRENKRAILYEKLQQLRSAANSHALTKTSIIIDASKYIEELKEKVDRLNQDIAFEQSLTSRNSPVVSVETLEKGFLINVFTEKNCQGLLVSVLEAFEELGLNVVEARVSCTDHFRLQAVGGETEGDIDSISVQEVEEAVLQAIENSSSQSKQG